MKSQKHSIVVEAVSNFLASESEPDADRYVFAYTITICNQGDSPARLVTRHWHIGDANGRIQEVRGEGVVGVQPHLQPGESFRYTSSAMISTPVGIMKGSYGMVADDGERFDTEIPPITLAMPRTLH